MPQTLFCWVPDPKVHPTLLTTHSPSLYLNITFSRKAARDCTLASICGHPGNGEPWLPHSQGAQKGVGGVKKLLPHFIPFFSRGTFQRHPREPDAGGTENPQGPESSGSRRVRRTSRHASLPGINPQEYMHFANFPDSPLCSAGSCSTKRDD